MFSTYLCNIMILIFFLVLHISRSVGTANNSSFRICPQSVKATSLVEGFISSPIKEWRSVLQTKLDCYFHLRTFSSSKLVLRFAELKLDSRMPECQHDYLEIFVGCQENSIGRFCTGNSNTPHLIYSHDHCIKLHFHWSGLKDLEGIRWQGFRAYYFSVDHVASNMKAFIALLSITTTMKGMVFSSGWPSRYRFGVSESWVIKVPPRCGTKLVFMDVDFGVKSDMNTCLQISAVDNVGKSETSIAICSSTNPFYKIYYEQYNQLSLRFSSNGHGNTTNPGRGVLVGYMHFCRNTALKDDKVSPSKSHVKNRDKTHIQVIIPSSFVIMIILLSVTVKIFFYKRRSSKAKSTVNVESSEDNSTEHLQVSAAEKDTRTNEQHFDQSIDCSTMTCDLNAAKEMERKKLKVCFLVPVQSRKGILNLQEASSEIISGYSGSTENSQNVVIHKEKTEEKPLKIGWPFTESQPHKNVTARFIEAVHSNTIFENNEITFVFACEQSDSDCSNEQTTPITELNSGCCDTTPQFGSKGSSEASNFCSVLERPTLNAVTPGNRSTLLKKCWQFPGEDRDFKPKESRKIGVTREKQSSTDENGSPFKVLHVTSTSAHLPSDPSSCHGKDVSLVGNVASTKVNKRLLSVLPEGKTLKNNIRTTEV